MVALELQRKDKRLPKAGSLPRPEAALAFAFQLTLIPLDLDRSQETANDAHKDLEAATTAR
jgi:hypothetical protein